jgi:hypothetical protein
MLISCRYIDKTCFFVSLITYTDWLVNVPILKVNKHKFRIIILELAEEGNNIATFT